MSEISHIVIRRISANRVNMMPTWFFVAPPGPLSYLNFAHALTRHLGRKCEIDGNAKVSIIHHDCSYKLEPVGYGVSSPENIKSATEGFFSSDTADAKKKIGVLKSLPIQPSIAGDLVVSLIIRVRHDDDISITDIEEFLHSGKLAGGKIQKVGGVSVCRTAEEALRLVKNGFCIFEHALAIEEGSDVMTAWINDIADHGERKGWNIPILVGYASLEGENGKRFREKEGSRFDYPHTYAEPLVGTSRYVSIRDTSEIAFWSLVTDDENGIVRAAQSIFQISNVSNGGVK